MLPDCLPAADLCFISILQSVYAIAKPNTCHSHYKRKANETSARKSDTLSLRPTAHCRTTVKVPVPVKDKFCKREFFFSAYLPIRLSVWLHYTTHVFYVKQKTKKAATTTTRTNEKWEQIT